MAEAMRNAASLTQPAALRSKTKVNKRTKTLALLVFVTVLLITVTVIGLVMDPSSYAPDYTAKRLAPSLTHLFGTDNLGRDMLARTIKGLSSSILIGTLAAGVSAVIALALGVLSATLGGVIDRLVTWLVDACMGIPHLILLILISFALGGGVWGVTVAVALTHWPSLTRIIRAEVLQLRTTPYVQASHAMGKSGLFIAVRHIVPHVIPQFIVGLILLFPHAILHESALTFLGFGLPLDSPAIGAILSESMKYLSTGMWWLALFPGAALLAVVLLFYALGDNIKMLADPRSAHE